MAAGSANVRAAQVQPPSFAPGETGVLNVKSGLPGIVIAVRGNGGLTKFTVKGPGRPPIEISDIIESDRRTYRPGTQPKVLKAPRDNVTDVLIPAPQSGRWTVEVAADFKPVTELRLSEGAPKPTASARISTQGNGRAKLRIKVRDTRSGVTATMSETGPSGGQTLGRLKLKPGRTRHRS